MKFKLEAPQCVAICGTQSPSCLPPAESYVKLGRVSVYQVILLWLNRTISRL